MEIKNTKEYRDALHAIKEFESNFDPTQNGEECYILSDTDGNTPIVVLDQTVADKMYVETGNYVLTKGIIVGLNQK